MREFCVGHACSPGSSGRQWQGGGGNTFEGSLSSRMSSGFLGSVLLNLFAHAHHRAIQLSNRTGNTLSGIYFRACLVEGFAVD